MYPFGLWNALDDTCGIQICHNIEGRSRSKRSQNHKDHCARSSGIFYGVGSPGIFCEEHLTNFAPSLIGISVGAIVINFIPESIPAFVLAGSLGKPAILSSVGARLLINMKEAGEKGLNEGMGSSAESKATVSEVDFTAAPAQTSVASRVGGEEELGTIEEIEMVDV